MLFFFFFFVKLHVKDSIVVDAYSHVAALMRLVAIVAAHEVQRAVLRCYRYLIGIADAKSPAGFAFSPRRVGVGQGGG